MSFYDNNSHLFSKGALSEYLNQRFMNIKREVNFITEQWLHSATNAELLGHIHQQIHVAHIELLEDQATVEREETQVDVSHDSDWIRFGNPGPRYVDGFKNRISIPFRGDYNLWDLRPKPSQHTFPRGNISLKTGKRDEGTLTMVYEFPADESAEKIKEIHEWNIKGIRFYLNSQHRQIESAQASLDQKIVDALTFRKDNLKRHDSLLADTFGISIKSKDILQEPSEQVPNMIQNKNQNTNHTHQYDVFISYASENEDFARSLSDALQQRGKRVWFDKNMAVGDSVRRSIDNGLANSRFGVPIISQAYLKKEWTKKELDALFSKENRGQKVILPVWYDIDEELIRRHSPMLADRKAILSNKGLEKVAIDLINAMK